MVFLIFLLILILPCASKADGLLLKFGSGWSSISGYEELFKDYPVYLLERDVYPSFSISFSQEFKSYYFEGGTEFLGVSSTFYFYSGDVKEYRLTGGYIFAGGGFKKDLKGLVFKGGIEGFFKFYEKFSVDGSDYSTDFLSDFFPAVVFTVDAFLTKRLCLFAVFKNSLGKVLSTPIAEGSWNSFNLGVGFRL
ncbi:hypothetical protein [Desulfurobacterium atlanticum]|uniref:Outer membrane protein beta-barrel domain-containing protein n=1 Tax=Desulfurobacterium atlanticum TaxID=240169 RepID=A0A238ZNZ2_9BACT|nr:hypothetical protein [Desulfurobacterium atlanticum]SNR84771.1 hypothetical protein SAMN06265340_11042 [Desulfurobacterium atlanticum]